MSLTNTVHNDMHIANIKLLTTTLGILVEIKIIIMQLAVFKFQYGKYMEHTIILCLADTVQKLENDSMFHR